MADALNMENECLKKITAFNKTTKGVKRSIDVLTRAVCSVLQINTAREAGLQLISTIPEGTIFTRTCREGGEGGGVCGNDLARDTTFTNMTTLGNLMIGNPKSINDSVVFLKTTRNVNFLDLTVVAQLFGAQVKSGIAASDEVGTGGRSRGIFSACCPIPHMHEFCRRLGVHGVIQIDSADAYYFNEDEDWIPEALKQGTAARHLANQLVLEAIINKRAYPVFQEDETSDKAFVGIGDDPRLENSGALFPEFNFHTTELKQCLEYCTIHDPIFQEGGPLYTLAMAAHEVENLKRQAIELEKEGWAAHKSDDIDTATKLINTADIALSHAKQAEEAIPFKILQDQDGKEFPFWNLNKILSNGATAISYLNFQKDYYRFQEINNYQWVENFIDNVLVLRLNPTLVARQRLINNMFQSSFVGLPYLTENRNDLVEHFEHPIIQLLISDDPIPICGSITTSFPSSTTQGNTYQPLGLNTIWTEEYTGGRKKTSKKRKKRTPYRKQITKRNSKLKPRRRRKGRTRRTRYKKKAGKTRH